MENSASPNQKAGNGKTAWIVAIVVLVGVIVALNNVNKEPQVSESMLEEGVLDQDSLSESAPSLVLTTDTVPSDSDQELPYTQAFLKYNNKRVSFDARCFASPESLEVVNNTKIMLDNRSAQTIRVSIGKQVFPIGAYSFVFTTLSAQDSSGVYTVGCGDRKEAAQISLKR